jgi:hypothetical protein
VKVGIDVSDVDYERDSFEKVKESAEFENLCDNLQHEITYFDDFFYREKQSKRL